MINKPTDLFGSLDWSDLQSQYLDALNSFNTSTSGKNHSQSVQDQWVKALDFWWQSNKAAVPQEQRGFYSHLLNQGKSMYFLADQFSKMSDAVSSMDKTSNDWVKTVEQQIESMKESFQTNSDMGMEGFQDVLGKFSVPNDAWSNFSNSIPNFAQGLGVDGKGLDLNEAQFEQLFEKFISIPGVGYNREKQEKIQKNILLYKEYQKVNNEYNQAMSKVGLEGLEKLKVKLVNLSEGDEKIETLRQIYNLWVDCNEDAYAEYVFSEEYSILNGRMINALMEFKKHHSGLMEEIFAEFNMPSKRELDELLFAQQGLREKLKRTEEEKANTESRLNSLEKELAAIRAEMSSGISRSGTSTKPERKKNTVKTASKSRTKTKSAARKKVTRKKAQKKSSSNDTKDVIEIKF